MDILFVTPMEQAQINEEVNGTMLLATKLLQADFDVQILRFCQIGSYGKDYLQFIEEMTDRILSFVPKAVSFYTLWPGHHVMLRLASEIKKRCPEILTVMGGPQASATAEATMTSQAQIDYICTGEGENTVIPFFTAALAGNLEAVAAVPGVYYRCDGQVQHNAEQQELCDLDSLPYWDERLLGDYDRSDWAAKKFYMPIDVGRGCPFNCSFCCSSLFWKRTYRLKSTQRLIDEIRYYRDTFGIRSFMFSHDAFTVNRKLVLALCDRLMEENMNITWKCTTRVNCVDEELLLKMKQAGLIGIELGVESGSERMQQLIRKKVDLKRVRELSRFMLDIGLEVNLYFMYGFPEETEEDLNDTLNLQFDMLDMGVQKSSMTFCCFNPQTDITRQYMDQLVLDPNMKLLTRAIFGYQEELPVIAANREIFPFFYHLPTALREEYHYMGYLSYLYRKFPMTARYLRSLFGRDNLRFYHVWKEKNAWCFEGPVAQMVQFMRERPLEAVYNILQDMDHPQMRQLKSLLEFDNDLESLRKSETNGAIRKVYDFNYSDLQQKKPLEQLEKVRSDVMLLKMGKEVSVRILSVRPW